MAKSKKTDKKKMPEITFGLIRPVVAVPHSSLDDKLETVQGQEQSVQKLFNDYVLGRLDPRMLGGGNYDPEGSDDVDPFNTFGLTLEEADALRQVSESRVRDAQKGTKKTVANAKADAMQAEKPDQEQQDAEDKQAN